MTTPRTMKSPAKPMFAIAAAIALFALSMTSAAEIAGQPRASYMKGADISPAFEGWIPNGDGTYDMVFGYINRNWEQELHVPVGPENYFAFVRRGELDDPEVARFEPASADQGQPTYFQPRRNRFIFRVTVPPEAVTGDMELVWTLTSNGSTERAYASLARDYMIDNVVIMSETGALGAGSSDESMRGNEPPSITLEGPVERTVAVGEALTLIARVDDDGVPRRSAAPARAAATPQQQLARALTPPRQVTVGKVNGLFFSWFVIRGEGNGVEFDPPQVKTWEDTRAFANSPWAFFWTPPATPEDGRWTTRVTFTQPGTYVLRGRADDGGLFSDVEVTVHVTH